MFRNYLKVALRNLWKSKGFTAINVIGLAAGLGVCLLIVLYVTDELSYDRFNVNADRIYRIDDDIYFNNTQLIAALSPKPLGVTMVNNYPEIEQMTRVQAFNTDVMVKHGADWIQEHHRALADSTFFRVFTFPFIAGDPATALNAPHSVVIDETTARRHFNSTDCIGATFEMENKNLCKVTGVIRDMPTQSHFHFSIIESMSDKGHGDDNEWLSNDYATYLLVRKGTDPAIVQNHINTVINNYLNKELQNMLHTSLGDLAKGGSHFIYQLFPLTRIHLYSHKSYELEGNGNINYIYTFSFIAVLILLIACVNFMNLSTARSANRAKEVGIRKVAGSTRGYLIAQFLTESVLLSLLAMVLALGLAVALLPLFNQLAGKQLHPGVLFGSRLLPITIGLTLVVGCLAGSYPAFYLSSFQPIQVLKGKIASGFRSSWLRSGLVVFQFWISISLIIGTLIIFRQLNYIHSRDVGFDREQVLLIRNAYNAGDPVKTFRNSILTLSGVSDATLSGDIPSTGAPYSQDAYFRDASLDLKQAFISTDMTVDDHYVPTLGIKLIEGRNFDIRTFPSDSSAIILNETSVHLLGLHNSLHQLLYIVGDSNKPVPMHIIGVIKDFNYNSLHEKVGPVVLRYGDNRGMLAVRLRPGNVYSLVGQIESRWKKMAPGVPMGYTFLDNDFDRLYHTDQQTGQLTVTFSVFAILIACLGLFGLVTYAAEQRMKEIGIRKVLGAGIGGIMKLLSMDFARLVLIASLLSFPVAWWGMNLWLQSFAYRIGISWWVFVVAGAAAILIALVTVSFQTIRAAVANPVKSLRSE
jgi:putative ABC transport system permease protein